jgi:hypothetical protein
MTGREPAKIVLVKLAHRQNPDIAGGYWPDANPDAPAGWIMGEDVEDCVAVCRAYIEDHGIGGGNWTGGQIVMVSAEEDPNQATPVARVSYNGRVMLVQS